MTTMTAFVKAEANLNAIVRKHREVHHVSEADAHERLSRPDSPFLESGDYRAAYAQMMSSKDATTAHL